ncbi:MAG: hypothetical protein AAFU64_03650 [Bacteroidota bacterium]
MNWKKGRGKLGLFEPLMGSWIATEDSPERGKLSCTRIFQKTLQNKYIELKATWQMTDKVYEDFTLFGVDADKVICFWSFTSDGKNSMGKLSDVSDIHPEAFGFEAQMPGGLARQVYWPAEEEGFYWVVESKTKKGWNRFLIHHYLPLK